MDTKDMKFHDLEVLKDKYLGVPGTEKREQYEFDLKLDILGEMIKQTRKERHLTQSELGELIGVQKSQISRIESNASNVTIDTLMRVFNALQAKVKLQVELPYFKG